MKARILGAVCICLTSGANANLISDPGFESTAAQSQQLAWNSSHYGSWAVGDPFTVASSEGGITPLGGSSMLRFGNSGGSTTDIYQILDVTSYGADIDAGLVTAEFSAFFNSTAANNVGLRIIGWDAAPSNFSGITFLSGNALNALSIDTNLSTWEKVSDSAVIQSGVRYLALGIHAGASVPTTYADQSLLTLTTSAVPVPAAAWLFGAGLLSLIGVARRRKAA